MQVDCSIDSTKEKKGNTMINQDTKILSAIEIARMTYPRVSEIIGKQTEREMKAIPIETLKNAAERGTEIHSYCSSYLKGLWIPEIDREYLPYFTAFTEWADQNVEKTFYQNIRLYDDEKRFTGEFDCIAMLKDSKKTVLIDIKTSANSSKSWPVQLAAYKHLCMINGYEVDRVINIHLKKTKAATYNEENQMVSPAKVKTLEIHYEDLTKFWSIFSSSLDCFYYFDKKESDHVL